MDIAESPASGTKISLGSAFDKVSPDVHITENGELVIDENGNLKQNAISKEWISTIDSKLTANEDSHDLSYNNVLTYSEPTVGRITGEKK